MHVQVEGENIYYEDVGAGAKALVFLHNAGGDHQFFRHQVSALKTHYRIVTIDLPGHGQSVAAKNQYSLAHYAEIVFQFCRTLDISRAALVGLNNGANIAIEIADQGNLTLDALVLIDPPLFLDASFIDEINQFIAALHSSEYENFIVELVAQLLPLARMSDATMARQAFLDVNKTVLAAVFSDLISWDMDSVEKIQRLHVPVLTILTDGHHCSYEKLQACNPRIEIGKTVGSRCWATLEVPEQVNAMLERFFEITDTVL